MSECIERIKNLIRVVSQIPDKQFNLGIWYNQHTKCGCALGHAMQDAYFIARRFYCPFINLTPDIAAFFDISIQRTEALFIQRPGYETRHDVLAALRVLLLEKMAQELPLRYGQLPKWIPVTLEVTPCESETV